VTGCGCGSVSWPNWPPQSGLAINICHFPLGTSKWNKIEHRMFSQISMNWRGQPLTGHEVIVNLIAGTTTRAGVTVTAELDDTIYPKGNEIADRETARLKTQHPTRHDFHSDWDYTVSPAKRAQQVSRGTMRVVHLRALRAMCCQPRAMPHEKAMPHDSAGHHGVPPGSTSARTKLLVSLGAAIVGGVVAAAVGAGRSAPLIGWDILAVVFCAWVWFTVWRLDATSTAGHAQRENPGRDLADVVLLVAAVASLIAVGVVLFGAGHANGNLKYVQAGFALVSVFVSWTLVHTVFTLNYARLYYSGRVGGIDFNQPDPPQYSDFAYLSFTIGMTFQVSDTNIESKQIRRLALRHAWLSFPLGVVIISASINLVAGLAK
jgi:uncharacterized membrane protein